MAFEVAMTDLCGGMQCDRLYYSECFPVSGLDLMVTLFCQWLIFKLIIISYLCVHDGVHGREREHFSRHLLIICQSELVEDLYARLMVRQAHHDRNKRKAPIYGGLSCLIKLRQRVKPCILALVPIGVYRVAVAGGIKFFYLFGG